MERFRQGSSARPASAAPALGSSRGSTLGGESEDKVGDLPSQRKPSFETKKGLKGAIVSGFKRMSAMTKGDAGPQSAAGLVPAAQADATMWLHMQGTKTNQWNKRFVVLHHAHLAIYEARRDPTRDSPVSACAAAPLTRRPSRARRRARPRQPTPRK